MFRCTLSTLFRSACAGALLACSATTTLAHPWVTTPARAAAPEAYFTNLKPGDRIETPFVVRFGLTGYGIAPITERKARAGHHHLLVNRELPLNFKEPLPFNDQYIHFGAGQMETVLNLPPGQYTLRLLLADQRHIPYFIYSKPTTITVVAQHDGVDPRQMQQPRVSLLSPADGATLRPPFRVQFHASGLNVAPADTKSVSSGRFRLRIEEASGGKAETIEFRGGQTETWLQPPPGAYRMTLEFVSNAKPGEVLHRSAAVRLKVE